MPEKLAVGKLKYNKPRVNSRLEGSREVYEIPLLIFWKYFFDIYFLFYNNNSILLYCANFYGRGFIRVYEDERIKVCTVQQYTIIFSPRKK